MTLLSALFLALLATSASAVNSGSGSGSGSGSSDEWLDNDFKEKSYSGEAPEEDNGECENENPNCDAECDSSALEVGSGVGVGSCGCTDYKCFDFGTEDASAIDETEIPCSRPYDARNMIHSNLGSVCGQGTAAPRDPYVYYRKNNGDNADEPFWEPLDSLMADSEVELAGKFYPEALYDSEEHCYGCTALETHDLDNLLDVVEAEEVEDDEEEASWEDLGLHDYSPAKHAEILDEFKKANAHHVETALQIEKSEKIDFVQILDAICAKEWNAHGPLWAWISSCFWDLLSATFPGPWKIAETIGTNLACALAAILGFTMPNNETSELLQSVLKRRKFLEEDFAIESLRGIAVCNLLKLWSRYKAAPVHTMKQDSQNTPLKQLMDHFDLFAKNDKRFKRFSRKGKLNKKNFIKNELGRKNIAKEVALKSLKTGMVLVAANSCDTCMACIQENETGCKGGFIMDCLGTIGLNIVQNGIKAMMAYLTASIHPDMVAKVALKMATNAIPGVIALKVLTPCIAYGAKLALKAFFESDLFNGVRDYIGSKRKAKERIVELMGEEGTCEKQLYLTICHPGRAKCYPKSDHMELGGYYLSDLKKHCGEEGWFKPPASKQAQYWIGQYDQVRKCLKETYIRPHLYAPGNGPWCTKLSKPVEVQVTPGVFGYWRRHGSGVCAMLRMLQSNGVKGGLNHRTSSPCEQTHSVVAYGLHGKGN